ncbi:MAG TPA: helix-turn-helix domain-containing protein [Solirubrobacteraceae bacterium]|jgi:AcrR family transcriptional regulator|nr:helix-turn-helix domain-containing protein [Solirubrobacteraceae bacterium]
MATTSRPPSRRVPAAERRKALVEAAVVEFGRGGLHGTPVDRIARRVGVAQPYVFSLFGSKRELFLAAIDRNFEVARELFALANEEFRAGRSVTETALGAMGKAYVELLESDRDFLLMQVQMYAACDDEGVREHAREKHDALVAYASELSGVPAASLETFFNYGMVVSLSAALGADRLERACEWVREQMSANPPTA